MLKRSLLALSACLTLPVCANWSLDAESSKLHFISTKNAQVSEIHRFETLSGTLSDAGELSVTVPLSSVDTSVAIRDTRMKEMLFKVANFPEATFSAQLPDAILKLKPGNALQAKVEGVLELHGQHAPLSFDVLVNQLDEKTMTVATVSPALIEAQAFGLENGIHALQKIAGLASISMAVPVTFAVKFEDQQ